jgi:hypothetical protein
MSSSPSPTDSPPIATPGKSSAVMSRTLSSRSARKTDPCTIPKSAWSGRVCASRDRFAHRRVRRTAAAAAASVHGYGGHSSNAIAMSAPSACCTSIERSGVSSTGSPDSSQRKRTPLSSIWVFCRENTWKPPESVRIGCDQPMKRCRPPAFWMMPSPGLSIR